MSETSCSPAPMGLSLRECNIVRCIAGYIVLKMKKKFQLHSGFFDRKVVTTCNYFSVSSVDEYTCVWVEQVNRGGLYNVKEEFNTLIKEVDTISRSYLDVRAHPSDKLSDDIMKDALACPLLLIYGIGYPLLFILIV